MMNDKRAVAAKKMGSPPSSRRVAMSLIGLGLMMPLVACGQGERRVQKETVLALVMYSYLDRPIYDIVFDGTGIGVANKYGGTGIITDVRIPFGIQTLRWNLDGPEGAARNGELVEVKNKIVITPEKIPSGSRYIGLHLYPDHTAEVTFAEGIPERTERGKKILLMRK